VVVVEDVIHVKNEQHDAPSLGPALTLSFGRQTTLGACPL
jgi:hypothetical protein